MFDLSGTVALVTGCRRGIGLAMAEALAVAGADVVGTSLVLPDGDSEARKRVEAAGRSSSRTAPTSATRPAPPSLCRRSRGTGTRSTCSSVTPGRSPALRLLDHTDDLWSTVIQTNLTSAFVLARDVGRQMVERGRGKIVFTASLLSFQGGINVASYTAAKSGLVGLVRALSNEWAPRGVNVNAIVPGYIATDNTQALRDDPERYRAILDRIPAGRWGEPADLAGATVFLASRASDYVNGIVLPVDGGWLGR